MKNDDINPNQAELFIISDIVDLVITSKETAEILNCSDSSIRRYVQQGLFESWEYRKTHGNLLFNKKAIVFIKENNLIEKRNKNKKKIKNKTK